MKNNDQMVENPDSSSCRQGFVFVILAAILWALSGSVSKFLFTNGLSPFQLVQLRTTISSVSLLVFLLARHPSYLKVNRGDLLYFVLLGILLAATQFTYLYAISKINVAAAILLQYQAPVVIAVYSVVFEGNRLTLLMICAILLAIIGCYFMVGGYNLNILGMSSAGIIAGLTSAVSFALYSVRSERGMRSYRPWTVIFYALLFAAIVWNIFHPPFKAFAESHSITAWSLILFVGFFGTVLPFGFYNKGIKLISATRASITATLEPVAAGVISYAFLGESMEPWQVAGGVLVIGAILLLQTRPCQT